MIIVRVGDPRLFVTGFEGSRDGGSALESGQLSLGFRRVVEEVTAGPFRTAGETSEETRPGENCEKCEPSEKEYCGIEDEASVDGVGALSNGWSEPTGGGSRPAYWTVGGHLDLARPKLKRRERLVLSAKEEERKRGEGGICQLSPGVYEGTRSATGCPAPASCIH